MSVKTEVERREIGYRFNISIDKEIHIDSGTRTPDKVTIHASVEGNVDTYEQAMKQLKEAKTQILNEIVKQEESSKEAKPSMEGKQDE